MRRSVEHRPHDGQGVQLHSIYPFYFVHLTILRSAGSANNDTSTHTHAHTHTLPTQWSTSHLADALVAAASADELQLVAVHDGQQLLAHVLCALQGAILRATSRTAR